MDGAFSFPSGILTCFLKLANCRGSVQPFRKDLYYRLKVIHISTPPLREIREDIPLLANYFLAKYCREMGEEPKKLAPGALKWLVDYPWPGNTREFENEMKRLVVLSHEKTITEENLSETMRNGGGENPTFVPARSLKQSVEEVEKRMILEALQSFQQNQLQAAKALGLSRQGLIKKMKRYGFKSSS